MDCPSWYKTHSAAIGKPVISAQWHWEAIFLQFVFLIFFNLPNNKLGNNKNLCWLPGSWIALIPDKWVLWPTKFNFILVHQRNSCHLIFPPLSCVWGGVEFATTGSDYPRVVTAVCLQSEKRTEFTQFYNSRLWVFMWVRKYKMESICSVVASLHLDFLASIHVKDAYLHVLIFAWHPMLLVLCGKGRTWSILWCFPLASPPLLQVFTNWLPWWPAAESRW